MMVFSTGAGSFFKLGLFKKKKKHRLWHFQYPCYILNDRLSFQFLPKRLCRGTSHEILNEYGKNCSDWNVPPVSVT